MPNEDEVMEIAEERIADALVLHASGRLDGTTAAGFESAVLAQIDGQPKRLVLDLADVDYVSSAGLRAILLAVKRGKSVGCALALCRLREHIREVFDLSGFGNVVAIHATVEEALGS
jgi:anti-sigma B factor antagonist